MILMVKTASKMQLGFHVSATGDCGFGADGAVDVLEVSISPCVALGNMGRFDRIWVKPMDLLGDDGTPLDRLTVLTAIDRARALMLEATKHPLGENWP